ncbi:peroxisomal ATPase PEX1 [Takifugu rubripes]|uniref:Peroxisomal ATPase PEX1 n=1 Tax=Takifugu rubripes TaxID=31033 RepID=H2U1E5_TAKRU|nr:peroxisome biogenesis factor 1 [Takifugu rubripes]
MFSNQGIQPVTLVFNNKKNCFLRLPSKLVTHLSLTENQALELSWGAGSTVFLSWTFGRTSSSQDSHEVELCQQLGEKLGLKDGQQGFLRPCQRVSSVHQVFVEPLASDDWEILELHSATLEEKLLDQIRVVFKDAVFPVWVDNHTVIYILIASLSPSVPYGRLEQSTELIVSPKNRDGIGNFESSLQKKSKKKHFTENQAVEPSSSSSSSLGPSLESTHPTSHQWGALGDLKSLLRYMIKGPESVKELPPVPNIPALFTDSLHRVCGKPPGSLCTISQIVPGVIHLFPVTHESTFMLAGSQPSLTYGLLSRVFSPKEARDKAKQVTEKKKNSDSLGAASVEDRNEMKGKEVVVVRVVCHDMDSYWNGRKIKSGQVWIPSPLAIGWNVAPHSKVRIKPVKSAVKVASFVRLQPINPLPLQSEEEIQAAFLDWLHTQSHEPLACLTPRSGKILFHADDAKLEFVLSVLKPEAENDPPDQLFLLSPAVIQKNIQLERETAAPSATNSATEAPKPDLPSLSVLGGIKDLSETGYEFISNSLLGSPLSQVLCQNGRGLKGGALLITGAKGSGKSSLSKALCGEAREQLDAHVEIVDCKNLQGKRLEAVRQIFQDVFEEAEWRQPSVVLLDDLDQIAGSPTSPEHEHSPEAVQQLHVAQSLMDVVDEMVLRSSLVCLIITSLSERSLHPSLTEAQGSHVIQGFVRLQLPDQAQRAEMLRCLILRKNCISEETLQVLDLAALAKETEGYTPQDLAVLLERAVHANVVQRGSSDDGLCLSQRDFMQALKGFTPPSLWGVDLCTPSGVGLDRVGGLKEVRQQLMDTILLPAKYPVLFSKLPIRLPSGILLFGAPGTGKTLLARAVAKESGMNFISIKGPELLSKYIGASEQAVRDVFQRAQAAKPCILFFDEFDSLAPRRGHDSTGVTDRVVNQLLTQMDGVEGLQGVYVIAATSRPDLIDPALLRPGRLDKSLHCPPPDLEARVEILKALSAGVPMATDVELEKLAAATEQFTGADLKALLYNAQLEAMHSSMCANSPHELSSGSEGDMSLSSMIFPNNSSGSDDSVGEGDPGPGLDPSTALTEPHELQVEEHRENVWRLYYGSSCASELGNSPVSGMNSPCLVLTSGCHPSSSIPPVCAPFLQSGFAELNAEQLELQQDIATIKKNYRRATHHQNNEDCLQVPSSRPGLLLSAAHLNAALAVTRPSLSRDDWNRYTNLYEAFGTKRVGKSNSFALKPGQRVSLA